MRCVHTHQRILATKGWGNPSCVQSTMEKTKETNWKAKKISWVINQTPTLGLKYDKI